MILTRGRKLEYLQEKAKAAYLERETLWKDSNTLLVFKLACLGALDTHICDILGISTVTLNIWKRERPQFFDAIKRGKAMADMRVAESHYLNCIDRWVEEEEIHVVNKQIVRVKVKKFYKGESRAQIKWLSARQPETWSESYKTATSGNMNTFNNCTIDYKLLSVAELSLMESIHKKQIPENEGAGG
jgi:hypothetical protein